MGWLLGGCWALSLSVCYVSLGWGFGLVREYFLYRRCRDDRWIGVSSGIWSVTDGGACLFLFTPFDFPGTVVWRSFSADFTFSCSPFPCDVLWASEPEEVVSAAAAFVACSYFS